MAQRLTWQNIAAPDFSAALRGIESSGELFRNAGQDLGSTLMGVAQRQRDVASTEAMARAIQTRDVDEWDRILASGGLAGLGVTASQVNPEFMDFLTNYREDLATDRADDLSNRRNTVGLERDLLGVESDKLGLQRDRQIIKQGDLDYERDVFGFGRDKVDAKNADVDRQRADDVFNRAEVERLGMEQARKEAEKWAREGYTPDEVRRKIINDPELDSDQERWALAALAEAPAEFWSAGASAGSAAALPNFQLLTDQLNQERNLAQLEYLKDEGATLYAEALTLSNNGANPIMSVIEDARSRVDLGTGDNQEIFDQRAGELVRAYEDLEGEYPNVPKEVIARVMQRSLTDSGFSWIGNEKVSIDKKEARAALDKINTPQKLKELEIQRAGIERQQNDWATRDANLQRLAAEYDLAKDRGDTARMKLIEDQFNTLSMPARANADIPAGGLVDQSKRPFQVVGPAPGSAFDNSPLNFEWALRNSAMQNGPQTVPPPAPEPRTPERVSTELSATQQTVLDSVQRTLEQDRLSGNTLLSPEDRATLEAQVYRLLNGRGAPAPEEPGFLETVGSWFR